MKDKEIQCPINHLGYPPNMKAPKDCKICPYAISCVAYFNYCHKHQPLLHRFMEWLVSIGMRKHDKGRSS